MATTLGGLVSRVRTRLLGAGALDSVAELQSDVDAVATALPVGDTDEFGPGLYEVGFEKVRVRSADAGSLLTFSFGRGYDGTQASDHAAGTMVTFAPALPASTILAEVNSVVSDLYPRLYGVVEMTGEYVSPFVLPAAARGVIAVLVEDSSVDQVDGLPGGWLRVDRWRWEPDAGGRLHAGVRQGANVKVVYSVEPQQFDAVFPTEDSSFAEVTLLPDRMSELVVLGVAAKLAPFYDFARLSGTGVEHRVDPQSNPAGQGSTLARTLLGLFESRMEQEQTALHREHPVRPHGER